MIGIRVIALLLALVLPAGALAQLGKEPQPQSLTLHDDPRGAPYNTGAVDGFSVPLRDFLSSRIDQLRSELIDRMEQDRTEQRSRSELLDRQYAQRFEAQQEALSAALLAAEKAVANALAAAKEAVIKAENAANDRFDGVNEMRGQLDDQARNFVTKDTFDAKFEAIETKIGLAMDAIAASGRRLDGITAKGEGANNTWALVGAVIILLISIGTFAMAFNRQRPRA